METQKETVVDSLEGRRVHLCLVSTQTMANLGPIERYQPNEVVLFVTAPMKDAAEALETAIRMGSRAVRISRVEVPNANDMDHCVESVLEVLTQYDPDDVAVNVTGGTKIMSMAACVAACTAGAKAFYLEKENKVSLIDIFAGSNAMESHVLNHKLKIKQLLASYGVEVVGSKAMGSLSYDEWEVVKRILNTDSMKEAIPRLNELAVAAEKAKPMVVDVPSMPGELQAKFDTLCDEFDKIGRLEVRGKKIKFSSEEDRFFVAGGWLERFVFNEVSAARLAPVGSLEVRSPAKNEIDVAFIHEGALHIIECKTSNLSDAKQASEVLYKLQTLKAFGGEKTKLLLVSYRELHPEARQRAASLGIQVITGRQILQIQEKIKAWLK